MSVGGIKEIGDAVIEEIRIIKNSLVHGCFFVV